MEFLIIIKEFEIETMHTRYSQTKERKLLKIIINIFKEIREDYISMKLESHAKGKIRELIKILIGG